MTTRVEIVNDFLAINVKAGAQYPLIFFQWPVVR